MNNKVLHKIISFWTVIFLLLPIGIQFAHTLENHEHVVCDSPDVAHIHNLELDCNICHLKLQNNSLVFESNFTFTKPTIHNSVPLFFISDKKSAEIDYKTTRGPPQFIV